MPTRLEQGGYCSHHPVVTRTTPLTIPWSPAARGPATASSSWATFSLQALAGDSPAPVTEVAVRADAQGLDVRFVCVARTIHATMVNDGDPLYLQDVVEVFLWPEGDGPATYVEYEVSPLGRDLCLLCCQHGSQISRWRPWGLATEDRPTCRVTVDPGRSWCAHVRLPWGLFAGLAARPRPGATWRANFYRIDHATGRARHLAWCCPPSADFHMLPSFGSIRFGEVAEQPTTRISRRAALSAAQAGGDTAPRRQTDPS